MATTTQDKLKLWLFPTMMSLLGAIIWNDVSEIKSDLKTLMAQSNIDKTRIEGLEKRLDRVEQKAGFAFFALPYQKRPQQETPRFTQVVALRPEEQDIRVYKQLPHKTSL